MEASVDIEALNQQIYIDSEFVDKIRTETSKVIVGQEYMIERLLLGLLAKGHVLLEGLPGLAKTLSIKTLSSAIDSDFQRIQFTPDLLPADIIGTMIYNPGKNEFHVTERTHFRQLRIADEINQGTGKSPIRIIGSHAGKTSDHWERNYNLG